MATPPLTPKPYRLTLGLCIQGVNRFGYLAVKRIFCCLGILALLLSTQHTMANDTFIHETFDQLKDWKPLYFPKVKDHSMYELAIDSGDSVLKTMSRDSASGLILKKSFDVFDYPRMSWRWKTENVYVHGNAQTKRGDDTPIRVYVTFKYNPKKAKLRMKAMYGLARKLYGEYPPPFQLELHLGQSNSPHNVFPEPLYPAFNHDPPSLREERSWAMVDGNGGYSRGLQKDVR